MASVRLSGVSKKFGSVTAVNNLSLDIADGEFVVLVGPSGCGKTTALRMIAGLEEATAGDIQIGEKTVNNVAPKDRDIAMVFQSYALYPHMTVYENMAFGLKIRLLKSFWWRLSHSAEARERKLEIDRRVRETATLLGLEDLLERKPAQLSGGQRQRVALGRAIVREPKVFLMDEPLSNLDAKLRVQTRAELIRLHRKLGITTIYVTHDQVEAMTMGDRIAVMRDGVLQQYATPQELYSKPANAFVGSFMGMPPMNQIEVRVENGNAILGDARFPAPTGHDRILLGIRPEAFRTDSSGVQLHPVVDVIEPLGSQLTVYLQLSGHSLVATLPSDAQLKEETPVALSIRPEDLYFFDAHTKEAIR
ncbi:MAG: sn-glycerol-3-phosphate ABC transporter ATP-binding protein UgpC [Fimbriimonadales bacterium]